jgi:hypothetical protein
MRKQTAFPGVILLICIIAISIMTYAQGDSLDPNGDIDLDGVSNSDDACPYEPGSPINAGCPAPSTGQAFDYDNDGVSDDIDNCLFVPGDWEFLGCPLPTITSSAPTPLLTQAVKINLNSFNTCVVASYDGKTDLRIRSRPDTTSEVVAILRNDEIAFVNQKNLTSEWFYVEYKGLLGWVSSAVVRSNRACDNETPTPAIKPTFDEEVRLEIIATRNTLTIYISQNGFVNLNGITLLSTEGQAVIGQLVLDDLTPLVLLDPSNVPTPLCIHLQTERLPIPNDCPDTATVVQQLSLGDVFWYSSITEQFLTVVVESADSVLGICTSTVLVCSIIIPEAFSASVSTITPTLFVKEKTITPFHTPSPVDTPTS